MIIAEIIDRSNFEELRIFVDDLQENALSFDEWKVEQEISHSNINIVGSYLKIVPK